MLEANHLHFGYQSVNGAYKPIFQNLNFTLPSESLIGIIGQNGSGKTTLLHLCSGIAHPKDGSILLNGRPSHTVRISYLFQNDRESLFPWLNIRDNVTFSQLMEGRPRHYRETLARTLCKTYGMTFDFDRFPYELSGGQQQMVSILRGFATVPDLLLLDEPFSSLDAIARYQILKRFKDLWKQHRVTCLFVSHDVEEVCAVAEKIVILGGSPTRVLETIKIDEHQDLQQTKNSILHFLNTNYSL